MTNGRLDNRLISRALTQALAPLLALAIAVCTAPAQAGGEARAGVAPPAPLPAPDALASVDDLLRIGMRHNLAARYQAAHATAARIGEQDPTHPAGPFLETQTLYWQMLYDDEDRRFDAAIETACLRTIELADAWIARSEDSPDAHFFAGQGNMNLGRLRGFRGSYYAAGKAGEKAREHLERALELRPGWVDAYYQLGAYYFYASLIPQMVTKWLGWLWFVPMGDADRGVAYIKQVAEEGDLFREDAQMVLANIYTYFREDQIPSALRMLYDLQARYPQNPLIHFELIEALFAGGDYKATIEQALRLEQMPALDERWEGRQTMATVWRARAELMRGYPERSLELLVPFEASPPRNPHWGAAWVDLTRGEALDVLGRREKALAEYREVLAQEGPFASRRARERASAAIDEPFVLDTPPELHAAP